MRDNSRSIIEVLQESLSECPSGTSPENTVRYKLIIDPSKDNSLIRYLFKFGVVKKENTRMFMRSDGFNDEEAQKVSIYSTLYLYFYNLYTLGHYCVCHLPLSH